MSRNFLTKFTLILSFALINLSMNTSCTKKSAENTERVLNVAIWANYMPPQNSEAFTKATGIKINFSNYASNEEVLAKIQAGGAGFDVVFPSDYMVAIMAKLNLLQELDKSKIPNLAQIDTKFMGQSFDPDNAYSLPYNFSTSGIAYNKDLIKNTPSSWKAVLNNKDLNGKISLLDDVRESMALALKMNNFSVNSKKPEELEKAKITLLEFKKKLKMFRTDIIDPLVNKEIALALAYSSDALQAAAKSGGKIEYVLAEEGGTYAIDNMVILKDAKNIKEAHELINFLLSQEANTEFVKTKFGTPVVKGVRERLPAELQNMKALFPMDTQLKKLESLQDLGDTTTDYDRIWTEVKSN